MPQGKAIFSRGKNLHQIKKQQLEAYEQPTLNQVMELAKKMMYKIVQKRLGVLTGQHLPVPESIDSTRTGSSGHSY